MPQIKSQKKRVKTNDKREAISKLDKAVVKGLHHRNYAIRQKSRLSKAVNSIA
mgnify:CR=1 FL=1